MEPRKASDVLLELEAKVDTILGLLRTHDLNNKIISNKLNSLIEKLDRQPAGEPKITVEAVNTAGNPFNKMLPQDLSKQIPVSSDFNLQVDTSPTGFRRTSRPETYAGDDAILPKVQPKTAPPPKSEVIVPPAAFNRNAGEVLPSAPEVKGKSGKPVVQNAIPVIQRIVDANGKSVFLADVEIIDLANMQPIAKLRTNGTGKWLYSLPIGEYRVLINKRESLSKNKLEVAQDIRIDGSTSTVDLPMVIIKK